ncbi:hypothetical protein GCM10009539_53910 [Cryptosporangium japonicum]|uniref:Uncharacterized protein n=1 Tax=Cryptosporangium japonicum TaxID=80872 RepID=A0ABN0UU19_9ACTN
MPRGGVVFVVGRGWGGGVEARGQYAEDDEGRHDGDHHRYQQDDHAETGERGSRHHGPSRPDARPRRVARPETGPTSCGGTHTSPRYGTRLSASRTNEAEPPAESTTERDRTPRGRSAYEDTAALERPPNLDELSQHIQHEARFAELWVSQVRIRRCHVHGLDLSTREAMWRLPAGQGTFTGLTLHKRSRPNYTE